MSEKITVPTLGESVTEATVSKWLKSQGEKVVADEPIVELETDKVNLEVPSPVSGILKEINSKDGSIVEVGAVLGSVSENGLGLKKTEEIKKIETTVKKDNVIKLATPKEEEEPKNMGAWFSVRDYIQWTLDNIKANNKKISYIGRSPDASPATGYAKRHISQQQEIIKEVFS